MFEKQSNPKNKLPILLIISEIIAAIFGIIGIICGLLAFSGLVMNIGYDVDNESVTRSSFFIAIVGISVSIILSFLILISKNLIAIRNKLYEEK